MKTLYVTDDKQRIVRITIEEGSDRVTLAMKRGYCWTVVGEGHYSRTKMPFVAVLPKPLMRRVLAVLTENDPNPRLDWTYSEVDNVEEAEAELEGYRVAFEYRIDEYHEDVSFLGEFTSEYQEGDVDWEEEFGEVRNHHQHRWYRPANGQSIKTNRDDVYRDFRRLITYQDTWWMGTVTARLYRGSQLVACDAIGGVESDSEHPRNSCQGYRDKVAWDCAREALVRAKEKDAAK